jgi:hypothetical protein
VSTLARIRSGIAVGAEVVWVIAVGPSLSLFPTLSVDVMRPD